MLVGIVALALCFSGPAGAQTKNPCAEDATKLCKDVKPGAGRIVNCLKENEKQLSPECREKLSQKRTKAQ